MNQKRQYRTYTKAFKEEAVALVIDQGYTVPDAAQSLGIRANLLYGWKQQFEEKQTGTGQGWIYLAIVMDLYSRRIIGWAIHKRMTVDLVERAMQMALNLRKPTKGLIFHSDRGSQYTSHRFQKQLKNNNITTSMSGRGGCLDNAVVERFFGSLKNEWLLNIYHLTHQGMKEGVEAYNRYYNQIRLHTSNGDCSPIEFEQSTINVSHAA